MESSPPNLKDSKSPHPSAIKCSHFEFTPSSPKSQESRLIQLQSRVSDSSGQLAMDPHIIRQFPFTQLYSDIQEGLQNLLRRKLTDMAPPLILPNQRYWVQFGKRHKRRSGGCWCTGDSSRACKPYQTCQKRPRPTLWKGMQFVVCNRPHYYGRDCRDRVCFDPNDSASEYLDKLLSERAGRPSLWCSDWTNHVSTLLADYELSERQLGTFVNAVCLIFWDLRNPFLDADRVWDPEVHGVLAWDRKPLSQCIDELMYEVTMVRLARDISSW